MSFFDIYPQKFYLLSAHSKRLMEFTSPNHELEQAVEDAFSNINRIEGGNIYSVYQYNADTLRVMTELSNAYKLRYPNVQQLPSYFKDFQEGDYFIRHQSWAPMIDLKRSMVKLDALTNGRDARRDDDIFVLNWGKLYLMFDAYSFGFLTDTIKVGEPDPEKRVCRFCGKSVKDRFKDVSHAIQEALGNKRLICHEECDECNNLFSNTVETHLYKLLEINRTLSNVSGKGKKGHNLEGLNFHIHPDPITNTSVVYVKQNQIFNDVYRGNVTGKIHLYNNAKISYQGVYKALLKIAIDMIPSDKIHHFVQTGHWVHGDFEAPALPYFSYGEYHQFFEHPVLDLFFKTERSPQDAPYCTAELRIFDSIFLFTIPFNDVDGNNYLNADEIRNHMNRFKQFEYLYVQEWEDLDANDNTLQTPFYKLSLFQQDAPYRIEFRPESDDVFLIKRDK